METDREPARHTEQQSKCAHARARERECECIPERKRQTEWVSGCERESVFLCVREREREIEREGESERERETRVAPSARNVRSARPIASLCAAKSTVT